MGFDPGSPGSRPGPKAGAKPLRHPGIPSSFLINSAHKFDNLDEMDNFLDSQTAKTQEINNLHNST